MSDPATRFPTPERGRRVGARAGMTLVELSVSVVVLVVAVGSTLGAISSFAGLEHANRETAVAVMAARGTLEALQAEAFGDVFARFNADPGDDPLGPGTGPGPGFAVPGLEPWAGDADGLVGEILFPTPAGAPGSLREDLVDADFGMPRDLDADGLSDALEHADDHVVLPVRVRVAWRGTSGERFLELQTLLAPR